MMFSWGDIAPYSFSLVIQSKNGRPDTSEPPIRNISASKGGVTFTRNDGNAYFLQRLKDKDGKITTGKLVHVQQTDHVDAVSCSDAGFIILSRGGAVFTIDFRLSTPSRPKNMLDRRVIQVACGNQHYMVLTQDGSVLSWGSNSAGQLGLGEKAPSFISSPVPLKALSGIPLALITAGGSHSLALSSSGSVFGWGQNAAGQLGLGDRTDRKVPVTVNCLSLKKTVAISCGKGHTAVLTKGGGVFTFGSGRYGQLGHNSRRDELRPRLVAELWGAKVTLLACGSNHTLVFVGSSNKIYSFGHGEAGQLGKGVTIDQLVPLPVQLPQNDKQIWQIFAGGNQSFALCSLGQDSEKDALNPSSTVKVIDTLDEDTIDSWLSKCHNSKSWKKIQKDIKKIFSSPSCLNGSFLDKSSDKHYQTSWGYSGLDLSLARIAFEKLATQSKVLTEVVAVVRHSLLPSLSVHRLPLGVEGLRVYLLLPELVRVLATEHSVGLVLAVADAFLSLHTVHFLMLVALWSRMLLFFKSAVKSFCTMSTKRLEMIRMEGLFELYAESLIKMLRVLQRLYLFSSKLKRHLPDKVFHVHEVRCFFRSIENLEREKARRSYSWWWSGFLYDPNEIMMMTAAQELYKRILLSLLEYPCIFSHEDKLELWMLQLKKTKAIYQTAYQRAWGLLANREMLLQNTFQYLRETSHNFGLPLQVKFEEEDGRDFGGVSMEFFRLLAKQLLIAEPQILTVNEHGSAWFSQDVDNLTDEFYLLGILCGMALYNQCPLSVTFPTALFRKLLALQPSLDDLMEMSPTEAKGLQHLLEYEEETVEELELDFGWTGVLELLPNGQTIPVTKVNRQKYVDLYVDMVFNKSVQRQFSEFERGFSRGCPSDKWKIFLPHELTTLVIGVEISNWDEFRQKADYEGFLPTDEVIQNFWTVFEDFSEVQKRDFLTFLAATDRLPRGRVSSLKLTIKLFRSSNPDQLYPQAETCFFCLHLPKYSSIQILRQKLVHAMEYCDVIGQE